MPRPIQTAKAIRGGQQPSQNSDAVPKVAKMSDSEISSVLKSRSAASGASAALGPSKAQERQPLIPKQDPKWWFDKRQQYPYGDTWRSPPPFPHSFSSLPFFLTHILAVMNKLPDAVFKSSVMLWGVFLLAVSLYPSLSGTRLWWSVASAVQLGTKHMALPGGATSERLDSFWPALSLTSGAAWKRHVFCPQLSMGTLKPIYPFFFLLKPLFFVPSSGHDARLYAAEFF